MSQNRKYINASATAKMLTGVNTGKSYESEQRSSSFSQEVSLPSLLCGELYPELVVADVAYVTANKNYLGQLMLTNYRLYFVETSGSGDCEYQDHETIDLPLGFIEECKKVWDICKLVKRL